MIAVHPGRVLKRELVARDLSANRLALALRLPSGRITLQTAYVLAVAEQEIGDRVTSEVKPDAA